MREAISKDDFGVACFEFVAQVMCLDGKNGNLLVKSLKWWIGNDLMHSVIIMNLINGNG